MARASTVSLILVAACLACPTPIRQSQSELREQVETATDAEAKSIEAKPKPATVREIAAQPAPEGKPGKRKGPFETTVWRVKAVVVSADEDREGDYRLTLQGEDGATVIAEVAQAEKCKKSPFAAQIARARADIEKHFHPAKQAKAWHVPVVVDGVGHIHVPSNPKPGAVTVYGRLTPVLRIEILKS